MKRILKKLILYGFPLSIVAALLVYLFREDLERSFRHWRKHETQKAIQKYGADLPPVDEVRLLRLADKPSKNNLGTYPILLNEPSTLHIAAEKTLSGPHAQEIATLWRQLRLHTDYMAGCYDPHHVVQFRFQGSVICEALIRFDCGNTTIPAAFFKTLVSFESFPKQEAPDYLKFQNLVETQVGAVP